MNITNINFYAEGYYSGQTYEENLRIRTEVYEKLKDEINSIKCYVGDLDGKHSEVEGDIEVEHYIEEDILHCSWDLSNDGKKLYYELKRIFDKYNLNLNEELNMVGDYLSSLDTYIDITISIKKSNVEKVKAFCKNL